MDALAAVFRHFSLSAEVYFCGTLCGVSNDHDTDTAGHLHLLRAGCLEVMQPDKQTLRVSEPSVLFYPRPMQHRLQTDAEGGGLREFDGVEPHLYAGHWAVANRMDRP
jgi:hypothetical protein